MRSEVGAQFPYDNFDDPNTANHQNSAAGNVSLQQLR
jgi:hypothetical protein